MVYSFTSFREPFSGYIDSIGKIFTHPALFFSKRIFASFFASSLEAQVMYTKTINIFRNNRPLYNLFKVTLLAVNYLRPLWGISSLKVIIAAIIAMFMGNGISIDLVL